jgi:hypothetical protein
MANEAYQYTDDDLRGMIRDTEREIFDEAVGNDELDGSEAQTLADMSQSEGWDGLPLADNEIAARTMQGDQGGVNYDRPLQMETETTLAADNYALRQQLNQVAAAYQEHVQTPQRQAAHQQLREQYRQRLENEYGLFDLSGPGEEYKLDRLIARDAAEAQAKEAWINNSIGNAHLKYGRDFDDVWRDVTSMDPNHPAARAIVQDAMSTSDPGEALMRLHGNPLLQSYRRSAPPPFMSQRGYVPPQRAHRPPEALDGGWGDRETEEDVFAYGAARDDEEWGY